MEAYKDKYDEAPSFFGGNAYDALMLVKNAVQKSGSIDPQKIRDGIEKNDPFIGVTGKFRMSETDHVGLTEDSLKVVRVKDGKWVLIQ